MDKEEGSEQKINEELGFLEEYRAEGQLQGGEEIGTVRGQG